MSSRRLQHVFKASSRSLENVLKTFLQDVLKTSCQHVLKTSWRHLENVLKTSWRRITKTNIFVLIKMSCGHLENVWVRWKYSSWSRRLLKTKMYNVLMTSSRRIFAGNILLGILTLIFNKSTASYLNTSQQAKLRYNDVIVA